MKKFVLALNGPDRLGIIAKITSLLAANHGFILEQEQFGDVTTGRFFMRCVFELQDEAVDKFVFEHSLATIAKALEMEWHLFRIDEKPRTLILVSKDAHCLNDLLHRMRHSSFPIEVLDVAANHPDLKEMSEWYGVAFHHLPVTPETKQSQERKIAELAEKADLVILARYMQILSPELTRLLYGKAINIHHSFLPSFKGAKP